MARIIYAASGDGLGHATRAHSVGAGLLARGHDVHFVSCLRSTEYLTRLYPERVTDIFGFQLSCEQGRINRVQTVVRFIGNGIVNMRPTCRRLMSLFDDFQPDLVITDVEWFTPWVSMARRIPFLSLDNQHLLTHCAVETPSGYRTDYWAARGLIRFFNVGARRYLVTTFIDAPIRSQPTTLLPPILRPVVYDTQPTKGDYLVAYLGASGGSDHMRHALEGFEGMPIRAYGLGQHGQVKRVTYRATSPEGFLADLAGAAGVVSSAGHSLISECLHLRKPMLLVPVIGQYEQVLNAYHVKKLGVGDWVEQLASRHIARFADRLDTFAAASGRIANPGLGVVLDAIEREIPTRRAIRRRPIVRS